MGFFMLITSVNILESLKALPRSLYMYETQKSKFKKPLIQLTKSLVKHRFSFHNILRPNTVAKNM